MTVLIRDAKALESLPPIINNEIGRLRHMEAAYAIAKSNSGYTKTSIGYQQGIIIGLKMAFGHILQEEWCTRNSHAVPQVLPANVNTFLEQKKD
jgi:hypothetical protein